MAVDQTEAMIAAIKAQLEKERAAEAAKQKRLEEEQALKNLSSNKKKSSDSGSKSQYKTLSAEELARIEEKKRRKREEALGIVHEDKPEETENNEAETNKPDTNKEAEGEAKEVKTEDKNDKQEMPKISLNLGGIADEGLGGLGSVPSEGGLSGKTEDAGSGLGASLNIKGKVDDSLSPSKVGEAEKQTLTDDSVRFDEDDMSSVAADDAEWTPGKNVEVKEVKTPKGNDKNGDLFSILPDRNKNASDVSSMYDIDDDDDDDFLGAGIENLSNIDETSEEEAARIKAEEEARKKAEEEAKKKAEEEAKKKAEEEAKRKAAEEENRKKVEEARKKAAVEKARIEAETKKKQAIELAERKAQDAKNVVETAQKTIADSEKEEKELKLQLEECAKKKAAYDDKVKAEFDAKKKADEELLAKEDAELDSKVTSIKKEIEDTNKKAQNESDKVLKECDPETIKTKIINDAQAVADAAIKKLADAKKANIEKHEAEYAKACKDAETSSTKLEEDKKKAIEAAKEKKEKQNDKAKKLMDDAEQNKQRAGVIFTDSKKAEEEAASNLKNTTEMESESLKALAGLENKLAESETKLKTAMNNNDSAAKAIDTAKKALKDAEAKEAEALKKLEEARSAKAAAEARISKGEADKKKHQSEIDTLNEEKKTTNADIAETKKNVESFKAAKAEAQQALDAAKKSVVEAEDLLSKAENAEEEAEQILEKAKIEEEVEIQNAEKTAADGKDNLEKEKKARDDAHEKFLADEEEKYATGEAAELEKVQSAAMTAEKEAADSRKKAEEAAKKLLDAAKKKEEELKKKIADLKTEQAERIVARKAADEEAVKKAEEKKKHDLDSLLKEEISTKKQLEEVTSRAAAAAKVLEKAVKKEEEARKQAELLKAGKLDEAAKIDVSLEATDEAAVEAEQSEINQEMKKALPAEAKYLYKYLCVNPAGAQIVNVLQTMKVDPKRSKNLVILGLHGFGSAKIGEDFAECYYDLGFCTSPAKAKVKAKVINSGKLAGAVTKLKGGCLIVESAGLITPERFKEMVDLCSTEKNDVKVILTGEKVALSKMLADNMTQARSFNNRVYFDQIKEENMIVIAKEYIIEKGYKYEDGIDGNIKNVLMAMESGNIDRLLTAIDEAIERADARNAEAKKVMKTDIK